jgi:hypothetical protein
MMGHSARSEWAAEKFDEAKLVSLILQCLLSNERILCLNT